MRLKEFAGESRDPFAGQKYYRALVTWFARAGLLDPRINYQQDIDLLIANFKHDWRRFRPSQSGASPPGSEVELQEFLLWQLPQYSSFEEEDSPARQVLAEVLELTISQGTEEALAMLNPLGKCNLQQLRDRVRPRRSAHRGRYGGVA